MAKIDVPKDEIQNYCMFIGYPRSGHTLLGAFLDAHPEMIISHELDALDLVAKDVDRLSLFIKIIRRSKWFLMTRNLQWQGFDYRVPNQWQGRYENLRVIGDKKGGASTHHLMEDPALLQKTRDLVELPLRIFHMTRNPFDIIATVAKRNERTLRFSTERFFKMAAINAKAIDDAPGEVFSLPHEDLIKTPRETLTRCVNFLGCEANEKYLNDCCSLVFTKPSNSRRNAGFPPELINEITERLQKFPFLRDYTFDA